MANDNALNDGQRQFGVLGVTTASPNETRRAKTDADGRLEVTGVGGAAIGSSTLVTVSSANNVALTTNNVIALTSSTLNIGTLTLTTTVLVGQTIATSSNTAVVLGTGGLTNGVICQAMSSNVNPIYVGSTAVTVATGFQLAAGQADSFAVANLNNIGLTGTSGDAVCYNGS